MENYTDEQLREELERRGYFAKDLWSKYDIESAIEEYNNEEGTNYGLGDFDWLKVLNGALTNEDTMSQIQEAIQREVEKAVNNFNNGN